MDGYSRIVILSTGSLSVPPFIYLVFTLHTNLLLRVTRDNILERVGLKGYGSLILCHTMGFDGPRKQSLMEKFINLNNEVNETLIERESFQ